LPRVAVFNLGSRALPLDEQTKRVTAVSEMVVVITGANAGLGYQTALKLARGGATVVMACRSVERARKAQSDLLAQVPAAKTTIIPLDVSEPESIQEFGRQFADRCGQLDILINNAGIVAIPLSRNSVGHEMQLATNYLGAFSLTGTLLPLFRKDGQARIVNVGSLAHRLGKLHLGDLNWEKTPYNEWKAYSRSKVAILSFTMELNRRLRQSGSSIIALGAHPGFAATEISKNSAALTPRNAFSKWINEKIGALIPPAAEASRPIIHAARDDSVRGGDYYGPSGFLEIRGETGRARVNPIARDVDIGRRLWTLTESMTGIHYLSDL
jgi:NAD(P)-dependent dehydrogenase (short-subunit alcohol dehydrogenase family)